MLAGPLTSASSFIRPWQVGQASTSTAKPSRVAQKRCVSMSAMFGKQVKEYVHFERWILILIVVVFALRLGLSLAGVPVGGNIAALDGNYKATEWVSINLVLLVGILYCAIAVQTRGFGTYKHLFPLLLFQATIAHWFGAIACFDMGIFT